MHTATRVQRSEKEDMNNLILTVRFVAANTDDLNMRNLLIQCADALADTERRIMAARVEAEQRYRPFGSRYLNPSGKK
jgi:hypothetical protein